MKIYYPLCQTYSPNVVYKSISKRWTNMQEASGYSTTPNVARTISCKAWNSPTDYPSWVAGCDIKASDGTMLNLIFWKKVLGQKDPGRWGIVKHQIPSFKVLFKTNAKTHKHPGVMCCFWFNLSFDLSFHKSCLNFLLKSKIRVKSETAPHPWY